MLFTNSRVWAARNQFQKMSLRPEQETFVNDFADTLSRRGLADVALLVLQAGQPLSFIGGQLLWMAQPALSIVLPGDQIARVAHLLEEPSAVQSLIARLEADEA